MLRCDPNLSFQATAHGSAPTLPRLPVLRRILGSWQVLESFCKETPRPRSVKVTIGRDGQFDHLRTFGSRLQIQYGDVLRLNGRQTLVVALRRLADAAQDPQNQVLAVGFEQEGVLPVTWRNGPR